MDRRFHGLLSPGHRLHNRRLVPRESLSMSFHYHYLSPHGAPPFLRMHSCWDHPNVGSCSETTPAARHATSGTLPVKPKKSKGKGSARTNVNSRQPNVH